MPYQILGAERVGGKILLKSAPFVSELRFTKPPGGSASLVFTDYSFTKLESDEYNGVYYHKDKSKDFGFTGHEYGGYSYYIGKTTGGAPVSFKEDHFGTCALLDSELHSANCEYGCWSRRA